MLTTSKIIVNQAAIIAATGLSDSQVNLLEAKGVIIKKARNQYDLIKSINNYIKYLKGDSEESDYYTERVRLTKAQADERELKVKEREGELVEIETACRVWCDAAILMRNNLLGVPNKISKLLTDESSPAVISQVIKKEIIATLESIKIDPVDYIAKDE